mmetsp:Transcript_3709/g.6791  ORF Transcript_3709/g.6791 Transcript_3709/m.6791 type:complete len:206 (+) Transcript_3709:3079-3696(+)
MRNLLAVVVSICRPQSGDFFLDSIVEGRSELAPSKPRAVGEIQMEKERSLQFCLLWIRTGDRKKQNARQSMYLRVFVGGKEELGVGTFAQEQSFNLQTGFQHVHDAKDLSLDRFRVLHETRDNLLGSIHGLVVFGVIVDASPQRPGIRLLKDLPQVVVHRSILVGCKRRFEGFQIKFSHGYYTLLLVVEVLCCNDCCCWGCGNEN